MERIIPYFHLGEGGRERDEGDCLLPASPTYVDGINIPTTQAGASRGIFSFSHSLMPPIMDPLMVSVTITE